MTKEFIDYLERYYKDNVAESVWVEMDDLHDMLVYIRNLEERLERAQVVVDAAQALIITRSPASGAALDGALFAWDPNWRLAYDPER